MFCWLALHVFQSSKSFTVSFLFDKFWPNQPTSGTTVIVTNVRSQLVKLWENRSLT